MGSNFGLSWGTSNQAFAAGQIGMFVSGSDVYTNMVQADNINPSIYGLAPIPLAKSKNAGVLGGGTLAAVSPKSSPAQIAAAMKWINFYYMQPARESQGGDPQRQDAGREQAAGRRAGAAGLQPGDLRRRTRSGSSRTSTFRRASSRRSTTGSSRRT